MLVAKCPFQVCRFNWARRDIVKISGLIEQSTHNTLPIIKFFVIIHCHWPCV